MKKAIYGLFVLVLVLTVLVVPSTKVKGEGTCGSSIDESTIKVDYNGPGGYMANSHDIALTKEDVFKRLYIKVKVGEGADECELTSDDFDVVSGLDEINSYIEAKEKDRKEVKIVFKLKNSNFKFNVVMYYTYHGNVGITYAQDFSYDYNNGELTAEKIAKLANVPTKPEIEVTGIGESNYFYAREDDLNKINEAIKNKKSGTFSVGLLVGYDDGNGNYALAQCIVIIDIINGKAVVNTSTSRPESHDNNNRYMLGLMFVALGGISTIIIKKKKTTTK